MPLIESVEGIMNAFSVGFKPIDFVLNGHKYQDIYGRVPKVVFTKVELLEISCVPVPSNTEALTAAI